MQLEQLQLQFQGRDAELLSDYTIKNTAKTRLLFAKTYLTFDFSEWIFSDAVRFDDYEGKKFCWMRSEDLYTKMFVNTKRHS